MFSLFDAKNGIDGSKDGEKNRRSRPRPGRASSQQVGFYPPLSDEEQPTWQVFRLRHSPKDYKQTHTTFNDGYLGLLFEEERSKMRYVEWKATTWLLEILNAYCAPCVSTWGVFVWARNINSHTAMCVVGLCKTSRVCIVLSIRVASKSCRHCVVIVRIRWPLFYETQVNLNLWCPWIVRNGNPTRQLVSLLVNNETTNRRLVRTQKPGEQIQLFSSQTVAIAYSSYLPVEAQVRDDNDDNELPPHTPIRIKSSTTTHWI